MCGLSGQRRRRMVVWYVICILCLVVVDGFTIFAKSVVSRGRIVCSSQPQRRESGSTRGQRTQRPSSTVISKREPQVEERRALLSTFDGKVAYRFIRKPLNVLLKKFEEKQLYISTRRGIARIRDLEYKARPINILFNPLANDEVNPVQLTALNCPRASISWKSLFSLSRDPLEINLPSVEAIFDAGKPRPSPIVERRIRRQWFAAVGEEFKIPKAYPTVEGGSYNIDQLVLVCKQVETPLPGYPNATLRLGMRDFTAVSVDREGEASNLRICWNSFNPGLIKARREKIPPNNITYVIAKRLVARDIQMTISQEIPPNVTNTTQLIAPFSTTNKISVKSALEKNTNNNNAPNLNPIDTIKSALLPDANDDDQQSVTTSERILTAPRGAGLLTLGYLGPDVVSVRFDAQFEALNLDLPESTLTDLQNDANSMALRLNVGNFNLAQRDAIAATSSKNKKKSNDLGLSLDFDVSGRGTDPALLPSSASKNRRTKPAPSPSLVARSALSVLLFLWSARIIF